MKNLVKIKQFNALENGRVVTANAIQFTNFKGYDFSGNNGGQVEYAVGLFEVVEDVDTFIPFSNGTCDLPYDVVENWGSDDSELFDYIINQIGFEKEVN